MMFTGPQEEAEKAIWIFDMLESTIIGRYVEKKENHDTWLGWHGPGTDGVGSNYFMASRLI